MTATGLQRSLVTSWDIPHKPRSQSLLQIAKQLLTAAYQEWHPWVPASLLGHRRWQEVCSPPRSLLQGLPATFCCENQLPALWSLNASFFLCHAYWRESNIMPHTNTSVQNLSLLKSFGRTELKSVCMADLIISFGTAVLEVSHFLNRYDSKQLSVKWVLSLLYMKSYFPHYVSFKLGLIQQTFSESLLHARHCAECMGFRDEWDAAVAFKKLAI